MLLSPLHFRLGESLHFFVLLTFYKSCPRTKLEMAEQILPLKNGAHIPAKTTSKRDPLTWPAKDCHESFQFFNRFATNLRPESNVFESVAPLWKDLLEKYETSILLANKGAEQSLSHSLRKNKSENELKWRRQKTWRIEKDKTKFLKEWRMQRIQSCVNGRNGVLKIKL